MFFWQLAKGLLECDFWYTLGTLWAIRPFGHQLTLKDTRTWHRGPHPSQMRVPWWCVNTYMFAHEQKYLKTCRYMHSNQTHESCISTTISRETLNSRSLMKCSTSLSVRCICSQVVSSSCKTDLWNLKSCHDHLSTSSQCFAPGKAKKVFY